MAVFRVVKDRNYSVISNYYLRNKNLSLKCIGLLTIVFSLPNNFNYSIENLVKMTSENYRTIKLLLRELKKNGYLVISKKQDDKGQYYYEYIWFESNSLNPDFVNSLVGENANSENLISPEVKNEPMDSASSSNNNNDFKENPEALSPAVVKRPLLDINTNSIYKINIDKTKLNLNFLTETLIDNELIEVNNKDLFGYDEFLNKFISENEKDYRLVIKVVNYVADKIKENNYLDEQGNPIINLLSYFKESCENNLICMKARNNPDLLDDYEE